MLIFEVKSKIQRESISIFKGLIFFVLNTYNLSFIIHEHLL
ncbi:hypothetical protein EUBDOL_01349 [Amedibacillus dolichus DSM 3991]|uniref:Uncharacterized protein n=1 Tax=Amedibacillus dolichus DSM 3991 TaxID=428127 RepID=A8RCC8_9FIRM|nr:hypothetical protein EUBDOL_01349 [Amedibacillus dolichus DSM 3991]